MAKKFPVDEFDAATQVGGRHRARRTAKDRVLEWLRIFAAAVVVGALAYGGLKLADNAAIFEGVISNASPSPTASVETRPEVGVIDGTGTEAAGVPFSSDLVDAGYNVVVTENLVDAEGLPTSIAVTTIAITDELFRAEAEAIAKLVGSPLVTVSTQFAEPITIVLGEDYELPAAE
ncbi:LytR C-terminal domain-containing protein [Rhodoluna limnophila]|uniref:LytR C-terminal domain-containing protein n=1 Tax=Rhodoluna limnophila TaxID=232537 RepID=UPI0011063B29|nr:LytR C-terminal domain-containing protein [Rhodoluna limnophila]